ncbi:DUF7532 family protein [Halorubrum sp. DTA98]|uniref:DUF7532 family protein n=1 Tax=Halorubrum sp. DTA98 TaxID=3402163 RepID=UPI003AAFB54C
MHFDGRTQRALHEAGMDTDEIAVVSDRVAELVAADADRLTDFFSGSDTTYSDMELAHGTADVQEHPVADVDLFTHGSDLRGYLSLDGWGVPVEDGRILTTDEDGDPTVVELTLGETIHDRVRFARDREQV